VSKSRSTAVAVPFLLLLVASGCSGPNADADEPLAPSASPPSVSAADARDRLVALGDAWFEQRANVTYRTVGAVQGQPSSTHQCLRQMVDTRADIVPSLRKCSRQGRLQLTWDPPERWRMEVTTPLDHFTLISTHDRARICPSGDTHSCHTISSAAAMAKAMDVFFQRPEQILDTIGATEVATTAPSEAQADTPPECFAATGRHVHVEWCYARDGLLLSYLRGSATEGWTSIDATSVSRLAAT
jgi:hypothetical protein